MSKLNDFVSGFEFVFHQPAQRRWEAFKLVDIFAWNTHVQSVQMVLSRVSGTNFLGIVLLTLLWGYRMTALDPKRVPFSPLVFHFYNIFEHILLTE